jgi:hypothetical protein
MMLKLPPLVTRKSNQQAVKNATEAWAAENLYCPKCLGKLTGLKANTEVKDFDCLKCKETYQLKAQRRTLTGALPGLKGNSRTTKPSKKR